MNAGRVAPPEAGCNRGPCALPPPPVEGKRARRCALPHRRSVLVVPRRVSRAVSTLRQAAGAPSADHGMHRDGPLPLTVAANANPKMVGERVRIGVEQELREAGRSAVRCGTRPARAGGDGGEGAEETPASRCGRTPAASPNVRPPPSPGSPQPTPSSTAGTCSRSNSSAGVRTQGRRRHRAARRLAEMGLALSTPRVHQTRPLHPPDCQAGLRHPGAPGPLCRA